MKTKSSTSIITYIGNGAVKGGIVYHEFGKKPIILSARIKTLKFNLERVDDQVESLILTEYETLLKEIKTEDFPKLDTKKYGKLDTALVVMSSPWYLSETNTIKMQEAHPFVVTEGLIHRAVSNITKAHKSDNGPVSVLEQVFLSVSMNGYTLNDPIGKKTKDLDLTVFTSYVKANFLKKVKKLTEANFHFNNFFIHSQSMVSYSAINDLYPAIKDYAIIDITSELTEFWIVKDGTMKDNASFPFGKYGLLDTISKSTNTSPEAALAFVKNYLENNIEPEKAEIIKNAIKTSEKTWLSYFSDLLKKFSTNSSVPSIFFLFAPHDIASLFKGFVESEEYQQFSASEGKFNVKIMNVVDSYSLCDIDKNANQNQDLDTSIVIGTLFNNKKLFS